MKINATDLMMMKYGLGEPSLDELAVALAEHILHEEGYEGDFDEASKKWLRDMESEE